MSRVGLARFFRHRAGWCTAVAAAVVCLGSYNVYGQEAGTVAGFEIDGDQACQSNAAGTGAGDDWADNDCTAATCDGVVDSDLDPSHGTQFTDCNWGNRGDSADSTQYKTGSNKNCDLIAVGQEAWVYADQGGGPQKNDITNVYVHKRNACTDPATGATGGSCMDDDDCSGDDECHTWIMVGAETRSTNGDSHLDFEINQAGVFLDPDEGTNDPSECQSGSACCEGPAGGHVVGRGLASCGGRTEGDISLDMSFRQGGTQPVLTVRSWNCDTLAYEFVTAQEAGKSVFSQTNDDGNINAGCTWTGFESNGASTGFGGTIYELQFLEGAIDQTGLGLDFDPCIPDATVLVKSRSSHSNNDEDFCNAQLKDLALFPFPVEPLPECTATDDEVCEGDSSNGICAGPVAGKGIPPFTIEWNDAANTTCTGLGFGDECCLSFASASSGDAGTYTATITDSRPCEGGSCESTLTVNPNPDVEPVGAEECVDAADPTVHANESGGTGTLSCSWSGAGAAYLSDTGSCDPTFDLSDAGVGTHEICVKATDEKLCESATECTNVIVNELPTCDIPAPDPLPLCRTTGNTLSANVSDGESPYDLTWSQDGSCTSDGCWDITAGQTATVPPDDPEITYTAGADGTSATFTLDVVDNNGCTTQCTRQVTCDVPIVGCLIGPTEVCENETLTVTVTVQCSLAPCDVKLYKGEFGALCDASGATLIHDFGPQPDGAVLMHSIPNAQLSDGGAYSVLLTDAGTPARTACCSEELFVHPNPTASPDSAEECLDADDPMICANESGGTGTLSCQWSGSGSGCLYEFSASACCAKFDLDGCGVGVHGLTVTVTDEKDCSGSGSSSVTVLELPTATASGAEECVDAADPTLHANESGGTGAISCAWSGACTAYLSDASSCDPTFDLDAAGPGTYGCCVGVTDSKGCEGSDCTSVVVHDLPICSISGPDEFCNTSTGNEYCGPAGMAGYAWSVSGLCSTSGATDQQCVLVDGGGGVVAGTCTVMLTVTDENGCDESCDKPVNVIVCNQACSPGYWKNVENSGGVQHGDEWCIAGFQPTDYFCENCGECVSNPPSGAATTFNDAFGLGGSCTGDAVLNAFIGGGGTLLEAVNSSNDKILFHCSAALLDAAHPGVADGSSVAELQGLMADVCDGGAGTTRAQLEDYCTYLIGLENIGGCPLN